jgi:hypothetical protein
MAKTTSAHKSVKRYRDRMRRAGFRLVQMWVPDTRAPGFKKECRRQAREAAKHKQLEDDVLDWIEKAADTEGWTA